MKTTFENLPFQPASILLPKDCDLSLWSVVACDQYTSQPEYWQRVEERVGKNPSTLRMILPESRLERPDVELEIMEINNTMSRYLRNDLFTEYPDSMIYVERVLSDGKVRPGLIGKVDLEQYDYEPGSDAMIRATEGTVLSRIPPRVAVRKNAPIEFPHVMLLADDKDKLLLEPLASQTDEMQLVYDFEMMEEGGHIRGWLLGERQLAHVALALQKLADPNKFKAKYNGEDRPVMLFAVGDGNHSLATAKECYERRKKLTNPEQWPDLPSRYALVEVGNLHDDSLEFKPIHRVLTGVDPKQLLADLEHSFSNAYEGAGSGHVLWYAWGNVEGAITIPAPEKQLTVATLQDFLDGWLKEHPEASIDYVHGASVAKSLAKAPNAMAFLLPAMGKEELFPTVVRDGVLPRKTFSMGRAQDKRFYLEGRRIRR